MPRHPPCALTHLTTTRCSHPLCNTQHTTTPRTHDHHHPHHASVRRPDPRWPENTPTKGVSSGPNSVSSHTFRQHHCVPPSTPTPTTHQGRDCQHEGESVQGPQQPSGTPTTR